MTTAHRPTFHPAIGSEHQGGFRYHAPRAQTSARDIAQHMTLKTRNDVEGGGQEQLLAQLEASEKKHFAKVRLDKQRKGLIAVDPSEKALQEAEDEKENEGELKGKMDAIDWSQFDDDDESVDEDSDSDSDDDEDERAAIMQELEKLKREKEIKAQKAAEDAEAEAAVAANPLLAQSFGVKRRWDDDVVFRNQSDETHKQSKRFINDTLRSDFHRRFMGRYIK
jgi:protein CWC15